MAGFLWGWRDASPSRPPKPVNPEAVFTMLGRAGRQSYGTGETGLRGNIQLSFSDKEFGFQVSLWATREEKPNPGVFAQGTG